MSAMKSEETGCPALPLQLRDGDVQVHAVKAFDLQRYLLPQDLRYAPSVDSCSAPVATGPSRPTTALRSNERSWHCRLAARLGATTTNHLLCVAATEIHLVGLGRSLARYGVNVQEVVPCQAFKLRLTHALRSAEIFASSPRTLSVCRSGRDHPSRGTRM